MIHRWDNAVKIQRQDTARTRKSLLNAASEVFAEKGYRDATIAEICERAGTNIAAVNYHFGNKETLYRETWRQSFRDSIRVYPPDGGVPPGAPPEKRLVGQITALLRRTSDVRRKEFLITLKELANPTGLLESVMQEEMRPLRRRIMAVLREILGQRTSQKDVRHCTVSILSQCVMPALINIVEKSSTVSDRESLRIDDIDAYADHVTAFSLAGIESTRKKGRSKETRRASPPSLCRGKKALVSEGSKHEDLDNVLSAKTHKAQQ